MSNKGHSQMGGDNADNRPFQSNGRNGSDDRSRVPSEAEGQIPLQPALAQGGIGAWQADLIAQTFTFNEAEAKLLGVPPDVRQISLEELVDRIHPDDRDRVRADYQAARENSANFKNEFRLVRPDGTTIWIAAHSGLFRDADGEPTHLVGIHVDISERKEVEAQLERLEEWRLLSVEAAEVGDWEYDVVNQLAFWSPKSLQQMGLEEETTEFTAGIEPIHPDDRDEVLKAIERALDPDNPDDSYQAEFRLVHEDGTVVWVESRGHAIFEPTSRGRRPLRLVGAMVDVTERKRAEKQLRENRRRLATLMSNLPGMAYRCLNEPHWPMTFVSEGCEELCGYTVEELMSGAVAWDDLIHPDDRNWLWDAVQEAVDNGERFEVEYRIQHADGTQRWMWEQGCAVEQKDNGETIALEGFITDVTARKEAEQELRAADRRKNQFLAMLGHELRNPLMAISAAAELLGETQDDSPLIGRAQRIISRQSRQMTRLIDGLLDISRITRGKLELDTHKVDLVQILRDLLEDRHEQLAERQVRLEVDPALDSPIIEADPVRVSQVFDNLLVNAIKFTDADDRIELDVGKRNGQVEVSVRDTGAGIAPELLPHIFEPFQQAPQDVARSQGGLGLGLALARELIELHGGEIDARSEGIGAGSEFVVRLPLMPGVEVDDEPESVEGMAKRTVLLVEDHPDIAEILSLQLNRAGLDIETASTAAEGLELVRDVEPALVVCDLGLPEVDGFEFAARVRSEPELEELPLVALTGYGDHDTRERSLQAGFDAHLVKPVDIDELLRVVERLAE